MNWSQRLCRLLPREERVVAWLGLGAAAVLLVSCTSFWWLSAHAQRAARVDSQRRHAESLGASLVQSLETMLAHDELSTARRLVSDAARLGGFTRCRVTLPDGSVLADAEASAITATALPAVWPKYQLEDVAPGEADPETTEKAFPLSIPGKGRANLELAWAGVEASGALADLQLGIGLILAGGLGAFGVIYRAVRTRTRALAAIDEALSCVAGGESEPAALRVGERFGPQAGAWNNMLDELVELRRFRLNAPTAGAGGPALGGGDGISGACDALWHGMVVLDEALRVRYANGAAAIFVGTSRDAMNGKDLGQCISDAKVVAALRGLGQGSARSRVVVESGLASQGDAAVFRLSARALKPGTDCGSVVLIEDVTQQRVADRSRNHFVAQVTHELRTPLTNIRLCVESLIEEPDGEAAARARTLNMINLESRRLERIVGDMLSVSEIEAGTMKLARDDLRLDAMFEELEHNFRSPAAARSIALTFALPPKLPVIHADRDKIVLALSNLIGNAIKYTPEGGKVSVTASSGDGQLSVAVTDTGMGIPAEEHELIFERFYRSKDTRVESITGTGLGLTLARQVVRLHGGDISVTSALNKGTTMTLTLPSKAPISLAA